jgi:hypothetical protein
VCVCVCAGEKWGMPFHFYRPSQEKYSADQVTTHSLTHTFTIFTLTD